MAGLLSDGHGADAYAPAGKVLYFSNGGCQVVCSKPTMAGMTSCIVRVIDSRVIKSLSGLVVNFQQHMLCGGLSCRTRLCIATEVSPDRLAVLNTANCFDVPSSLVIMPIRSLMSKSARFSVHFILFGVDVLYRAAIKSMIKSMARYCIRIL